MSEFYTIKEVSMILDVPESTLYQQSREGRLPKEMGAIRIGNKTRFSKRAIDRLVQGGVAA